MNDIDRRRLTGLLLLAAAGGLAGCGFSPVYQSSSTDKDTDILVELSKVDIELIPDREGQMLHNFLLDRMQPRGQAAQTPYRLITRLSITTRDLGVQLDETTERSRIDVNAAYTLTGEGLNRSFRSRISSSFSTVDVEYASLVAEQDAIERSLRSIAGEMTVRVAAALKAHKAAE
ncbi:MAG: hypothetical protein RIM72_13620 [Alphaproteobacteria bacterium]